MINKYPRGSEWRIWDLQIQTILDDNYLSIGTYFDELKQQSPEKCQKLIDKIGSEDLIKKYDSKAYFFTDNSESELIKCKNYAKLLLNYVDIFNEDVGAICVTDHNYEHGILLDTLIKESESFNTKVIPGVEINIQGVHCLVIFGEKAYGKSSYSDTIKTFLTTIGITNKLTGQALTVCSRSYTDVIDEVNRLDAILIYPHCNSSKGLFQERGKTDRTHLANSFNYQKVNILQSQNRSSADIVSTYIGTLNSLRSKHVFTLGSDARALKDIFKNDESGNYCWIKADPTFEGLRQIIFEPDDRVSIQALKPDKKEVYRVISEIKVQDQNFSPIPIPINSNLTVIIGSRSSGKTTLLNSIAKAVDEIEFDLRLKSSPPRIDPPLSLVKWEDGITVPGGDIHKGITYIPQNYIINLAEATDGQAPILDIAEKAIFDNGNPISTQKEELDVKIESLSASIVGDIFRLFSLRKQIVEQKEKIKLIGDKAGIVEQIRQLNEKIKALQKNFTQEERDSLTELSRQFSENKNKIEVLSFDIGSLNTEIVRPPTVGDIFQIRDINLKSEQLKAELLKFEESTKVNYINKYLEYLTTRKNQISVEKTALEKVNSDLLKNNKALIDKSRENKVAGEIIKEKETQEKKFTEIIKEEDTLQKLETQLSENISTIVQTHDKITEQRNDFVLRAVGDIDGIEYKAVLEIDKLRLGKYLDDSINVHNSISCRTELNALSGYKDGDDYDPTALVKGNNIRTVLDLLLNEKLKTKVGVDTQKAVEGLFTDFEFINYSLSYEGDVYPEMTPGKKALVVLKLLVESSRDEYPILIDQPEDDLDSRSISNEIVSFLKEKKKKRQIILVTHNANIAIKADAEEIIVVNRHGAKNKNANNLMFDYSSGAIEHTFVDTSAEYILDSMGTREHACVLLEGGKEAFENRRNKFNIKQ